MANTELAAAVRGGGNIVFFGGAGVSTESGIPDFRSESGLYAAQKIYGHSPEELLSHSFFARRPEEFFRYYRENLVHAGARPNAAHIALARLEDAGMLSAVVTQNIDGLHQAAGSGNVLELHGSVHRNYCTRCGARYPLSFVMEARGAPVCGKCGGLVRPDVVLYGEALDGDVLRSAACAVGRADTLIVGGTSLAVYPAAGLLEYFNGGRLVLINKSATPYDGRADVVIRESIGAAMDGITGD
jgi:NAD-dependent deacetylase